MNWQELKSLELQNLFERHGYRRFVMSKFEEYDFYAENRSFLSSENILTFTGLDGKLLALKPDVTLSIVKNTRGTFAVPDRVYYNENVYRARKGDKEYREIMQAGLELIGSVGPYETLEVLLLAKDCLKGISDRWILDLSHMGFVAGLLEKTGLGAAKQKQILKAIREKNAHELAAICAGVGVEADTAKRLAVLADTYGGLSETLPGLRELCCSGRMEQAYAELAEISDCLARLGLSDRIHLDFSIVGGMDYYNGIMFQGYIEGVPEGVLSGGRYDNLTKRFGKDADAIGFAVYLDLLERLMAKREEYDTDVLLLYKEGDDPVKVAEEAERIAKTERVMAVKRDPGNIRYRWKVAVESGSQAGQAAAGAENEQNAIAPENGQAATAAGSEPSCGEARKGGGKLG